MDPLWRKMRTSEEMKQCIADNIQRGEGLTAVSERERQLEWTRTKRSNKTAAGVSLGKKEWGHGERQTREQGNKILKKRKMTDLESAPMLSGSSWAGRSFHTSRDEWPRVTYRHPPLWSCTCHSRHKVASNREAVAGISWRILQLALCQDCCSAPCESRASSV